MGGHRWENSDRSSKTSGCLSPNGAPAELLFCGTLPPATSPGTPPSKQIQKHLKASLNWLELRPPLSTWSSRSPRSFEASASFHAAMERSSRVPPSLRFARPRFTGSRPRCALRRGPCERTPLEHGVSTEGFLEVGRAKQVRKTSRCSEKTKPVQVYQVYW